MQQTKTRVQPFVIPRGKTVTSNSNFFLNVLKQKKIHIVHPLCKMVFAPSHFAWLKMGQRHQTFVFSSYYPELIIISHYILLRSPCTHWYIRACLCGCVISVALPEHGVCTWLVFSGQLTGLWWLSPLHLGTWEQNRDPREERKDRGG